MRRRWRRRHSRPPHRWRARVRSPLAPPRTLPSRCDAGAGEGSRRSGEQLSSPGLAPRTVAAAHSRVMHGRGFGQAPTEPQEGTARTRAKGARGNRCRRHHRRRRHCRRRRRARQRPIAGSSVPTGARRRASRRSWVSPGDRGTARRMPSRTAPPGHTPRRPRHARRCRWRRIREARAAAERCAPGSVRRRRRDRIAATACKMPAAAAQAATCERSAGAAADDGGAAGAAAGQAQPLAATHRRRRRDCDPHD